jgi:hypothetical protein
MSKSKVQFEYDGYDVIAKGHALNEDNVSHITLAFPGLNEEDYPSNSMLLEIKDIAIDLILEQVFHPEMEF